MIDPNELKFFVDCAMIGMAVFIAFGVWMILKDWPPQ